MEKILITGLLFFATTFAALGQSHFEEPPYIEVTGSADIEIEPDDIRLAVIISSYKKVGKEIKLEEVDEKLKDILKQTGISKDNIILKNTGTQGYWYYGRSYDPTTDARVIKQYEIIFSDYARLNKMLTELPGPKEGFVNVNISGLKNTKILEYRKQIKIEALKAAQAKAQYLLESVGCSAGKLIQVIELDEDDWSWYRSANATSNVISQTSLSTDNSNDDSDTIMQKIKLRYRIKARFLIQ